MSGKLFLHIGRNKAGSTTLQNAWLGNVDRLRAGGIQYALFGLPSPPGHDLPSFPSHMAMVRHVQDNVSSSTLVSHEGLCCFPHDLTAAMAADIARLDVTLLFYVRPYRHWVVSDYIFNAMIGEQTGDFDSYLGALGDRASFWPMLSIWGNAVGWDRVRVRSLHPDDLVDRELIADGMAALGLAGPLSAAPARDNPSQPWISAELIRFLLTDPSDPRRPVERHDATDIFALVELVNRAVKSAAAELDMVLGHGAYLTAKQSARLRDLYNADLDTLADHSGQRLHRDDEADAEPRPFLPDVRHIPRDLSALLQAGLMRELAAGAFDAVVGDRRRAALLAILRGSA